MTRFDFMEWVNCLGCVTLLIAFSIGMVANPILTICLAPCILFVISYISDIRYLSKQKSNVISDLTTIDKDLKRIRATIQTVKIGIRKCQKYNININPQNTAQCKSNVE